MVRSVAVLIVLFLLSGLGGPMRAGSISEKTKEAVRQRVVAGQSVGIVVGVVDADGRDYFSFGKRAAGGPERVDERSVYEIGSISKAFTGILLADMTARGVVKLEDTVQSLLPGQLVRVPSREGREISLLDLATHRSSLPRLPNNLHPADPANPYADYTVGQMYEFLSGHELRHAIGSKYEYSNLGMGLVGHALALKAGMSYEDLVLERISRPLGLNDTRVELTPGMRARMAKGHRGGKEVSNWDIPTLAGAGALRSTAHDMLTFLEANLGLRASPISEAMSASHEFRAEAAGPVKMALGWHLRENGASSLVWHNGGTGGYRTFAGINKAAGKAVVVLSNSNVGADDIGYHVLDPSYDLVTAGPTVSVEEEILEKYVGEYALTPAFKIVVSREGGQLFVQATNQPRFKIFAESETRFVLKAVNAAVTFKIDESGAATAMVLHQGGRDQEAKKVL